MGFACVSTGALSLPQICVESWYLQTSSPFLPPPAERMAWYRFLRPRTFS
uniref:Uncharacterized protein n=1 Tax=Arundo donax TaxID=35708 RepID=A0A0A9DXK6_ARUDO